MWADVDLDATPGLLSVRRALKKDAAGAVYIDEPKTRGSRRTIHMPRPSSTFSDNIAPAKLNNGSRSARLGGEWSKVDLMFTSSIGTPLDPDRLNRDVQRLTELAGLGRWTPHELDTSRFAPARPGRPAQSRLRDPRPLVDPRHRRRLRTPARAGRSRSGGRDDVSALELTVAGLDAWFCASEASQVLATGDARRLLLSQRDACAAPPRGTAPPGASTVPPGLGTPTGALRHLRESILRVCHRPLTPSGGTRAISRRHLTRAAFDPAEAAVILGVCRQTIYALIDRGRLRRFKVGRLRASPPLRLLASLAAPMTPPDARRRPRASPTGRKPHNASHLLEAPTSYQWDPGVVHNATTHAPPRAVVKYLGIRADVLRRPPRRVH